MKLLPALLLALIPVMAPGLASAQGAPFVLPDLSFPEDPAPVSRGCIDPSGTSPCPDPAK
ncbi:hypothetical protein [Gemmobacter denitrificans]|uniref:Uncharacterized protein n=1 Tax=Gemmobacter denitrificans TaxID=3123040 RepID=A0ABU8BUM0_9RHOB